MNYIIALLAVMAAVFGLMSFPVPTAIAIAVAVVWWMVKGRHRSVR